MDALQIGVGWSKMLVFHSDFTRQYSMRFRLKTVIGSFLILASLLVVSGFSQQQPAQKSQEISEDDGQPVLVKHLPDAENVQANSIFVTDKAELTASINNQPVLDVLDFPVGTEAVTAAYPQGRLLIVEYTNPQSSIEADNRIQQHLGANPQADLVYRRIGNYNAFVFGTSDSVAANRLLDQVKYQKTIQWLGEDPYLLRRLERYMITTSRDIMISTVLVIVFGIATSIVAGIAAGFIFYRVRDQRRLQRTTYSDAGGLTRLNLDGLSE